MDAATLYALIKAMLENQATMNAAGVMLWSDGCTCTQCQAAHSWLDERERNIAAAIADGLTDNARAALAVLAHEIQIGMRGDPDRIAERIREIIGAEVG